LGTGALSNTQSIAGYFGQDFPEAHIDNDSYNAKKLASLVSEFPTTARPYDLVLVQIGGNDIMKFTPFKDVDRDITTAIADAKKVGRHVVILHSGNVGLAPIFIWPFDWIMSERARSFRRIYMQKARQEGVLYVDLFTERGNDLFLKDIPRYYCLDRLHPSGEGYKWWYERIRATLNEAGVVL
jgi:lysophospholipase L1-like esterase